FFRGVSISSVDDDAGMNDGLGANLYDASGNRLASGGISLAELGRVDLDALHPAVRQTDFVLAADVNNPLLGETGAAAVYGPQKGATPQTVAELDAALATWERILREAGGGEESDARAPGAGAAGGVGEGASARRGATR